VTEQQRVRASRRVALTRVVECGRSKRGRKGGEDDCEVSRQGSRGAFKVSEQSDTGRTSVLR
jgi:hypothetical protein